VAYFIPGVGYLADAVEHQTEALAGAVALSTLAASSIATVVAIFLPWLLHRLGTDPAFGSGPLATVVQDLLSIVIYFAVVAAIAM
jgi:magnesium transporter